MNYGMPPLVCLAMVLGNEMQCATILHRSKQVSRDILVCAAEARAFTVYTPSVFQAAQKS